MGERTLSLWTKVVIDRIEHYELVHQPAEIDNRVEIRWTGDSSARYRGSQFTAICSDQASGNYVACGVDPLSREK